MATRLWTDSVIMGTGQAIYAACQWGMVVVLARFGGPEMVGAFVLALAVTTPVMLFSNLSLRPALVTDMRGEHPIGRYLGVRLATTALGLTMIAALALGFSPDWTTFTIVLGVGFAKACENQSDILYGIAQRHGRFDLIATSMAARGVLGLSGLAAGVWLTGELLAGVLALALAWGLVLALVDWPASAPWRPPMEPSGPPRAWFGLVWSTLPLGIAALFLSLNVNVPRYVIAQQFGEAELGVFAAMASFVIAGGMVVRVFGQVASPRLARAHVAGEVRTFLRILGVILTIALALGLASLAAAAMFHAQIMEILYGSAFVAQSSTLTLMMVVLTFTGLSACLGFAVTALRIFRPAPLLHGITLATNLAGCALLADLGVPGVTVAWIGSLMVSIIIATLLIVGRLRVLGLKRRADPPLVPVTVTR